MDTQLSERVARLEREARLWRWTSLAAIALCTLCFGMPRVTAQDGKGTVLKAPVRVVDDSGATVVEIDAGRSATALQIRSGGTSSTSTATIFAGRLGGSIVVSDSSGKSGATLRTHEGAGELSLRHRSDTRTGAMLSISRNGGELELYDFDGKPVVRLPQR